MVSILLFFILMPYICYCSQQWRFDKINTGNRNYNCGRITYPCTNSSSGLELSIWRNQRGIRAMVSVLMRQIPPFEEESQALATLIDGSEQINFIADRMQGGQMLLLPDDIMEKIVASLQKNASIHLFLNGYEATITSDHFCQSWRKLCRLPV